MKKILIRVDISAITGGGHLMRMIGLAQLLFDEGYEIHIASTSKADVITPLLDSSFHLHLFDSSRDFMVEPDLENLMILAKELQPEWIVLDGYHFPVLYEQRIRSEGFRSMRIDDLPNQRCEADLLLNHNHGAESFNYDISERTIKLAGLKYLLLRREFRKLTVSAKKIQSAGSIRLLVCLGGGSAVTDALNLTIIKAASRLEKLIKSVTIIAGKMGLVSAELLTEAQRAGFPVNIVQQSENMAEEMLNADIAITAGGYSMWELLYMKTPYIAISLNTNQEKYTAFLAQEGLCEILGASGGISTEQVEEVLVSFIKNESRHKAMIEKSELLFDRANNGKELLRILAN